MPSPSIGARPATVEPPACGACAAPMQLKRIDRDPFYREAADLWTFECSDCGLAQSISVRPGRKPA
jgi:hypothetical protein